MFGRRPDGFLAVVLENRRDGVMGRTVLMKPEQYLCSLKEDPAFVKWWTSPYRQGHFHGDDSPYGMAALAWDAARTTANTTEEVVDAQEEWRRRV